MCVAGQPNIQDSVQSPVAVIEGENAPLTCVVRELGDATVVWKKWESGKSGPKILTAGETRVTSDERVRIIHDNGKISKKNSNLSFIFIVLCLNLLTSFLLPFILYLCVCKEKNR